MSAANTPGQGPRPWTLGAVLDEQAIDPSTHLFLVRADLPLTAARDLERRLLGLRLAGKTTLIVHLVHGARLSGAMTAALARARRKLQIRNGRLLVSADEPEVRHVLECAGLDLIDLAAGDCDDGCAPDRRPPLASRRLAATHAKPWLLRSPHRGPPA